MKVYVASAFAYFARTRVVQVLARARGHGGSCGWTQKVGKFESDGAVPVSRARESAEADIRGVADADVLIVLSPVASRKDLGCGMWVEMGMALARGIPVVISGGQKD